VSFLSAPAIYRKWKSNQSANSILYSNEALHENKKGENTSTLLACRNSRKKMIAQTKVWAFGSSPISRWTFTPVPVIKSSDAQKIQNGL